MRPAGTLLTLSLFLAAALFSMSFAGAGPDNDQVTLAVEVSFSNVTSTAGLSGVGGNFFSWGDVDNDGYDDLLVDGKRLFRNGGPPLFTFTEITARAGISRPVNSGVFGDFDGDGYLDIFCGGGIGSSDHPTHPDVLWRNRGDGTFEDVTVDWGGVSDTFPTVAGAWSDVDRNGYLDLYMVNYENGTYQGYPDHFFLNTGSTFVNATVVSGMDETTHPYQGRGASFADFDEDGWPDLYVSNYRIMPNYLYRNSGGEMAEIAARQGVEGHGNVHPVTREGPYFGHSLGSCWGDLDNDGDLDLWVTNLAHKDPWRGPICDDSYLFENLGSEQQWTFVDRREDSGIPVKSIPGSLGGGDELMVSCAMADYDNDGDLDLFLPQIYADVPYAYSYLYRNDGGLRFTDVSEQCGIRVWNTYGSAWCDFDRDGWMDLVTGGGNWDEEAGRVTDQGVHLYRNLGGDYGSVNGFVGLVLNGRGSNTAAIGAKTTLIIDTDGDGAADQETVRIVSGGSGAHGQQDSMVLHFGTGTPLGRIDALISWPMGREVMIEDIPLGTYTEVFEPDDPISYRVEVADVEVSEGEAIVLLLIENPSPYEIKEATMDVTYSSSDGDSNVTRTFFGIPAKDLMLSKVRIPIGEKDVPTEGDSVSVEVLRAFPAPETPVHAEFPIIVPNLPPIAVLEPLSDALTNEDVYLSGEGSYDPDGAVIDYDFEFGDGTSTGWQASPVTMHEYDRPGTYAVRLRVRDDDGNVSMEPSERRVRIIEPGPVATIISISPPVAYLGEEVTFSGGGDPTPGERIDTFEWSSDIDGVLSRRRDFTKDDLSPGDHVISLRVRDTTGTWSEPDTEELTVDPSPLVPDLWVNIASRTDLEDLSGPVMVWGSSGPAGVVVSVEARVDEGPWIMTGSAPDWTWVIDPKGLDPSEKHIFYVRSMDRAGRYSETVSMDFTLGFEEGDDGPRSIDDDGSDTVLPLWSILTIIVIIFIVISTVLYFLIMGTGRSGS